MDQQSIVSSFAVYSSKQKCLSNELPPLTFPERRTSQVLNYQNTMMVYCSALIVVIMHLVYIRQLCRGSEYNKLLVILSCKEMVYLRTRVFTFSTRLEIICSTSSTPRQRTIRTMKPLVKCSIALSHCNYGGGVAGRKVKEHYTNS